MNDFSELERSVYEEAGAAIRTTRKRLGLTLEQLSDLSGVSPAYIGQIERDVKKASLQTLSALAKGLGVSVSAFFAPEGAASAKIPPGESIDRIIASYPPRERLFLTKAVRELARGLKRLRTVRGRALRAP